MFKINEEVKRLTEGENMELDLDAEKYDLGNKYKECSIVGQWDG